AKKRSQIVTLLIESRFERPDDACRWCSPKMTVLLAGRRLLCPQVQPRRDAVFGTIGLILVHFRYTLFVAINGGNLLQAHSPPEPAPANSGT
ncbi:hypothetical protein pipiens_019932, partial [Culex pipiens pipiens]